MFTHLSPIAIIIIFISCSCNDDIVKIQVNTDGSTTNKYPELPMNKKIPVQFENKSGYDCMLYWVSMKTGKEELIAQAEMLYPSLTTITTFPGHKFVYTPKNDQTERIYEVIMSPYVTVVTLLPKERMETIDEQQKQLFYKNYYLQTGKHWKNYYPRDPLIYPHLNPTHIGQTIDANTKYTKYYKMTPEMEQELIINNDTFKNVLKEHKDTTMPNKGADIAMIDHHEFELDDYYVLTYNHTEFYRAKVAENVSYTLDVLCTKPSVMRVLDLLSDDECEHLMKIGLHSGLDRSTVGETQITNKFRTSSHIWVRRDYSIIVDNIIDRIGDMVQIDGGLLHTNASAEDLQLVHYNEGEYYTTHHDYGTDSENNRYITVLLYLNDVGYGGNTSFPYASEECNGDNDYFGVKPIKRSALIFYDMLDDANVDELSHHQAEPPVNGSEKWMTNLVCFISVVRLFVAFEWIVFFLFCYPVDMGSVVYPYISWI